MNNPEKPHQSGTKTFSSEARIGTGVTIAGLGFLGLLLAWAEQMRSEPGVATGWFVAGLLFMIVGLVMAIASRSKGR